MASYPLVQSLKNTGLRFYRTSKYANLVLTPHLHQIIIGCMLGDLHAERPSLRHNTRLQFKQSNKNASYVVYLYKLFIDFCGSSPVMNSYYDARIEKENFYSYLKFNTFSIPCFNVYRDMFYDENGVKSIPSNLGDHFTAVSLAHWFMDDGYKAISGYYLCTDSFTDADMKILINMLSTKFNLKCTQHKTTNGPRLYINSASVKTFNELIKPHFVEHFSYKLHK